MSIEGGTPNTPNDNERAQKILFMATVGGKLWTEWMENPEEHPDTFLTRKREQMRVFVAEKVPNPPTGAELERYLDDVVKDAKRCVGVFLALAERTGQVLDTLKAAQMKASTN